jgi:hypothetical protein
MLNYSKNGVPIMPTETELARWDDATKARFAPVQAAFEQHAENEEAEAAAIEALAHGVEKLDLSEKILAKFPQPTFIDLFRRSTSQPGKIS